VQRHIVAAVAVIAATTIAGSRAATDFDEAWQRLKEGHTYAKARTGLQNVTLTNGGLMFPNQIEVPDDYDPARRWPVRVQLHGGIGRPEPQEGGGRGGRGGGGNRIRGENAIYVYPAGWAAAPWWSVGQVNNILSLVDWVKRRYNVDESHIYLTGISDGGTGVFYLLMREPTIWSAGVPLISNMKVLDNAGAEGTLFAGNLVNRPLLAINNAFDPLYPVALVAPYMDMLERGSVPVTFRPQAEGGHDVSFWPTERATFEKFVESHARDPHPPLLTWETERTDRANRIHWLVIDELGTASSDTPLPDLNAFLDRSGRMQPMYGRRGKSGRVDVRRLGNTFESRSRGVRAFTLLLSPDVVDFSQPVIVTANGREVFKGELKKDVGVLQKWANRDNDRTMLYAAEVKVRVP
jgi:poly(3-hydroxybutyrate) depolymerase